MAYSRWLGCSRRSKLLTPRIYKVVFAVCGSFLLILGIYFLTSGVDSFAIFSSRLSAISFQRC